MRALVHTDARALEGLPVETVRCDVRDRQAVADALAGAEIVYHLAGAVSVGQVPAAYTHAINAGGTENVVAGCLTHGVARLVHCSSIHALDHRPDDVAVDERRPLWADGRLCSAYDFSKARAERAVLRAVAEGLDAVIVEPTAIVGPCDFKPSWTGRVLVRLAHGRQPALMNGGFDWVDARDLTAGMRAAAVRGRCGERYLLTGHWASLPELASLAAGVYGRRALHVTVPVAWAKAAAYPYALANHAVGRMTPITPEAVEAVRHCRLISRAKAEQELGYSPRPLRETVTDTVLWLDRRRRSGRRP